MSAGGRAIPSVPFANRARPGDESDPFCDRSGRTAMSRALAEVMDHYEQIL